MRDGQKFDKFYGELVEKLKWIVELKNEIKMEGGRASWILFQKTRDFMRTQNWEGFVFWSNFEW